MKIVVLAGGTSTERDVSIVSGTGVCKALREKGHSAVLLDVFFGWPEADAETAFGGDYDVEAAAARMRGWSKELEQAKKSRREFFGPKVIALCQAADMVFLALSEPMARMERCRQPLTCLASAIQEPDI